MSDQDRTAAYSFDWQDCTGSSFYVYGSIARGGGGYWPCMVNIVADELEGNITSDDARRLAAVLMEAADECDKATQEELDATADVRFLLAENERLRERVNSVAQGDSKADLERDTLTPAKQEARSAAQRRTCQGCNRRRLTRWITIPDPWTWVRVGLRLCAECEASRG